MEYSLNIRLFLASTLIGLSLVACNGGGSSPNPLGTIGGTPTPTPTPTGTATPAATVAQSVTPAVANGVLTPTLSSATLAGLGLTSAPTISVPTGVTLPATLPQVTYSNAQPTSITTFGRKGLSRSTKQVTSLTVPGATGLIFTSFAPTSDFVLPPGASATFTYPLSTTPAVGTVYNLAFFDGNQWNADTADVGVVSGNTVTVTATSQTGGTLSANMTYAVVLYSTSAVSASPSPSASPSATPTATASPLVNGTLSIGTDTSNDTAAISGAQGSLTLPGAYTAGNLNYSLSSAAPSGVTPPSGANTVYGYATLTPASTLIFPVNSTVTASLTPPSGETVPSGNYSFAYSSDGQTWVTGIGSSSIHDSNSTVVITASNTTNDLQLTGGSVYYVAVYQ